MNSGNVGKDLRINCLFNARSERSVVATMDHGLEDVGQVLDRLFSEDLDGVLMNAGMFRH